MRPQAGLAGVRHGQIIHERSPFQTAAQLLEVCTGTHVMSHMYKAFGMSRVKSFDLAVTL